MPKVTLYKADIVHEQEVDPGSNLVVLAGIKKFPHLSYGCGMGKCTRCQAKITKGSEHLDEPNWKEEKMLGSKLEEGYRLPCQLTIREDIEIDQS
ncbi:Ferredoxin [Alteribacillus persepolensis]|uniref:Ferredoxin n=1 Tax=Alteribacillus persepolensis TaxID=568899 RepID=A0A1G8A3U2_9BACI|nr:2Fe-2S iron-sulfur cluster-binding protein [Alteribacillus persepolensis]SDH15556.1 Ferredoxin [Alteribacillus persepolensis]